MKKHLLSILAICFAVSVFAQLPVSTAPQNRKIVLEEFTGIHCQYCPDGHRRADSIVALNPTNRFVINIHVGVWSTSNTGEADFRTPFGTAIANQSTITGYPAGTVNRHLFPAYSQNTVTPGTAMSRNKWYSAVTQIEALPSIVNVALQGTVDAQTRLLTVDVQAYYTGSSTVSTNYFNLALIQDSLMHFHDGAWAWYPQMMDNNGLYQNNKMLRHLLTGQWGDPIINTTTGSMYAKTFTYTIPNQLPLAPQMDAIKTDVLLSKLRLVGFVTETQQEILSANSGPLSITNNGPTGITAYDPSTEFSVSLFPNPANDKLTLGMMLGKQENVSIKIINALGAQVYSHTTDLNRGMHASGINVSQFTSGIYFVKVTAGEHSRTEKLIISK